MGPASLRLGAGHCERPALPGRQDTREAMLAGAVRGQGPGQGWAPNVVWGQSAGGAESEPVRKPTVFNLRVCFVVVFIDVREKCPFFREGMLVIVSGPCLCGLLG